MNRKIVTIIGITVLAVLAITALVIYKENNDPLITQARFIGKYSTEQNLYLAENVDKYMEKDKDIYCSHIQYGHDDKYVFTWMFCEGYEYTNYGGISTTGGFSIPTRFDYNNKTFKVNGYKQPGDGSLYDPTLKQIFPYEVYAYGHPSNEIIQELEAQTKHKYLSKLDPDLFGKLDILTNKYVEYLDWELQPSFAGKTFTFKVQNGSYYFAFITNGSGVGVVSAKCFEVKNDNKIDEIINSNITINSRSVDPITCKGIDNI
jgi:hypothetical protein